MASTTAVSDPRGLKRICMNCGNRFYDLNKNPIICPSCNTEFTGEVTAKTRRTKSEEVAKEAPKEAPEDDEEEISGADAPMLDDDEDVVSLDDLDDADADDLDDDMDMNDDLSDLHDDEGDLGLDDADAEEDEEDDE